MGGVEEAKSDVVPFSLDDHHDGHSATQGPPPPAGDCTIDVLAVTWYRVRLPGTNSNHSHSFPQHRPNLAPNDSLVPGIPGVAN